MAELFHDVDIVERTEITKEGRVEKVYRVSAYTASGVFFRIDMAERDFSKEKVAKALSKRAQQIEDIKTL